MKLVMIGHGHVGSVMRTLLERESSIDSIMCVDRTRPKRLSRKVRFVTLDARDAKPLNAFLASENPDVVVNTALPVTNENLLRSCLKIRSHYLDLASYWDVDTNAKARCPYRVEQLDYSDRFAEKKLIGVINAGVSPGLTNMLARECADHLDRVESIRIRLFEDTQTDVLEFPWSVEWLLDELNTKPLAYENGHYIIRESFSEEESFTFPNPLGRRRVCLIAQEEIGTIPHYITTENIDIKSYDNQTEGAKVLLRAGLLGEEPVRIGTQKITPTEFISQLVEQRRTNTPISPNARFALVVEADGVRDHRAVTVRISAVFPNEGAIEKLGLGANFVSYPTALVAALTLTHYPRITRYGVYPPEALEHNVHKAILNELKEHVPIGRRTKST